MACPAIAPETITLRFASVLREAQNKHNAPYAGFPMLGRAPVVVSRKLLKAAIESLPDARVTVEYIQTLEDINRTDDRGNMLPLERRRILPIKRYALAISSTDGRRRYVLYSRQPEMRVWNSEEQRAVKAFAARKRGSIAANNGWVKASQVNEETGEISRWSQKNGLAVKGSTVYHHASGKSVAVLDSNALAFVAAELILANYPDWTQDGESVLAMLGPEGVNYCRRVALEVF